MNIKIYSKEYVEKDTTDVSDRVLISMVSTVETPLTKEVCNRYKQVLQLRVDDIRVNPYNCEYDDYSFEGLTEFKTIHFELIKRFVDSEDKIDVHCGAGISRSSAVAIGVAMLRDDKESIHSILKSSKYIKPNPRILSMFYLNSGIVKCSDVWELIFWYRHKYHDRLSDNAPDMLLDYVELKNI